MSRKSTLTEWPRHWAFQSHIPAEEPDGNENPDRARWVLALGIISLAFGPLGVFAWMAGNAVLKAIDEGRMDPTCESNARAGRLLGLVAMAMFVLKVTVGGPLLLWWFLT
jgi:hypothetical protein